MKGCLGLLGGMALYLGDNTLKHIKINGETIVITTEKYSKLDTIYIKYNEFIAMRIDDTNDQLVIYFKVFPTITLRLTSNYVDSIKILSAVLCGDINKKVDLYKELKEKVDEVDSRADDAESEITELREKCILLEETVKKMKSKAKAVEKISRDINHIEADLLGINP